MQFKIQLKSLSKENCFRVGEWQCQQNELDKVLTADSKPWGIVWLHTRAVTRVVSACVGRDRLVDLMCLRALKQDDNTRLMWVLIVMAPSTYMPRSLTEQHELGRCTVARPRWECGGIGNVGWTRQTGSSFHSAAGFCCGSNSRRRRWHCHILASSRLTSVSWHIGTHAYHPHTDEDAGDGCTHSKAIEIIMQLLQQSVRSRWLI